ncbi:MAG TPA: CPBP family intramembrane glutamic endopeptidase, partial [Holophagaceae bacterium]
MAESRRLTETLLDGQDRVRDGWRVVGWIVLAEALEYVTGMAYGLVPAAHRPPLLDPWIGWATYLVATGLCLRLEGVPFASVGFRLDRRWCRDLGLGTLAGGAIMGACALAIAALGGFRWIRTPGFHPASLATGAFLYLGVALAEETYYRGYAFQRLVRGAGIVPAQILFALLFAYGHWDNPGMHGATQAWATLNIGLAALLLGLAWIRTGSLALPIG